jgi:hypothetical protein
MNKTILSIIMALLLFGLTGLAFAAEDGCFDIQVDVDDDEVKPGESFNVEVDVENNSTQDIEDIEVEVVIKDIDDGDDLDDDGDIDDLDDGDDDNIDFEFEVPYAVDEKDYDVIVTVKGELANGSDCESVINETVEVKKEKHELLMKQPSVDYETLKCSRTTEMSVTLWNIGDKDEDVDLEVYNSELGISKKQSFELESGDDEDDIKSTRRVSLELEDVAAKTYTFYVKAAYDDGDEYESDSFTIKVEDCGPTPTQTVDNNDVVVIQPTPTNTNDITPTTPAPTVTIPAIVEEQSFTEQYGAALLLGLAYVVVIVIGVLLVVSLVKKK